MLLKTTTRLTARTFSRSFHVARPRYGAASQATDFFSKGAGRLLKFTIVTTGIVTSTFGAALLSFFIYDATTYHGFEVPEHLNVSELAINPELGGPENLPILRASLDSLDSEDKELALYKPKLVILGSGWASVGLLKSLSPGEYDVTVISNKNYHLYTPLLPSAACSTLSVNSLIASIRTIISDVHGHFLEGYANKIEFADRLVKVDKPDPVTGEIKSFYVPYDKLVIAVGSTTNTHGVEGLEYCAQLKTAEDALSIRKKITENLEKACLPTTTDEERKKLLSFVVCGGGPTGVEFAAEVYDLLNEDLPRLYPKILRQQLSVHIIQSRSNILNTYDEAISKYAMDRFQKDSIDVLTNSRVQKILPDRVIFQQSNKETGETCIKELPFGLCLWSTGVSQNPLAREVVKSLGAHQTNKRAIETDSHLRVIGAPLGEVYAIGDCATVKTDLAAHAVEYVRKFIVGKHLGFRRSTDLVTDEDIRHLQLTREEFCDLGKELAKKHPLASESLNLLADILPKYIGDAQEITFEQVTNIFKKVDSKVTSLPATAQRAQQQGKYIGKKLSKMAKVQGHLTYNQIKDGDIDEVCYKPFRYIHLGSLAYIGNSAVFDLPGYSFVGGLIGMYLWRGIYFAQSVSLRTRVMLFMDWVKRGLFGRDIMVV